MSVLRLVWPRDLRARIDGDTMTATGNEDRVFIGFGSDQTIVAGAGNDLFGPLGEKVRILVGGADELVLGDRGWALVRGPGHDLPIDASENAIVRVSSSRDEVLASRHEDPVLRPRRPLNEVGYAREGDSIGASCGADDARVLSVKRRRRGLPAVREIGGDGIGAGPGVLSVPTVACRGRSKGSWSRAFGA
jgi:hypothetical protein